MSGCTRSRVKMVVIRKPEEEGNDSNINSFRKNWNWIITGKLHWWESVQVPTVASWKQKDAVRKQNF